MILTHGANSLSRGGSYDQDWTEDESVTTSLGHKIPVEDCGIEMGLQSVSEMPYMPTIVEDCGIEMGLQSVSEMPYMPTIVEDCGIEMGLISIEEITQ